MTIASTWHMYTESPPAPMRAPYFGRWPIATVGGSSFDFAWSVFDVWPELLTAMDDVRRRRGAK